MHQPRIFKKRIKRSQRNTFLTCRLVLRHLRLSVLLAVPLGIRVSRLLREVDALRCPAGTIVGVVGWVCWVSPVTLDSMHACYVERLMLSVISLLNNWSCSLIHRACCSNGDSGEGTVSVAIEAVAMCSMPSKSVRINCSSPSKDSYTGVFLTSRSIQ